MFKSLTPVHWAWLHAKAALIVWSVLFLVVTPQKLSLALGFWIATTISAVVLTGVTLSVVGLFVSLGKVARTSLRGLRLELAGLWVALGGLGGYFLTQFGLTFGPEGDQRTALTAFAYAMTAFLIVRIVIVREHIKKVVS